MKNIGTNAKKASYKLSQFENKDAILLKVASALLESKEAILKANTKDIENAKTVNLMPALVERLTLNDARIESMVEGIRDIVKLKDPIGEVLEERALDNGLLLEKVRVPMGVIGIIYESRPNVTVDAFALCFKSGNAVILKGGKEALETNIVLESIIRSVLIDLDPNCIQLIKDPTRESTSELMQMNEYVDVLIPRGSAGLINTVLRESTIPVIQTGEGNCHIYVDESADLDMALSIFKNAKTQRVGVCNACESLVLHNTIAKDFIKNVLELTPEVEFYGDEESMKIDTKILKATDEDFYTEYLDLKCSIKVVNTFEEAVDHINEHTTHHSESIITNNPEHMEAFLNRIDASSVYVNASTRFTDGYEFGLGAEIGISTQKLHARGPMGLEALTSYKYKLKGKGQIRK